MSSNPFAAAYLETQVLSASPVQLVHLAYEGVIEAIIEARSHLNAKRIHERSRAITRAQLLIKELETALDFNQGGDISVQLGKLYRYMQGRLREANFKQIEQPLVEVQGLLETVASAWKELSAKENPLSVTAASASSLSASSSSSSFPSSIWSSAPETPAVNSTDSFVYTSYGSPAQDSFEAPSSAAAATASSPSTSYYSSLSLGSPSSSPWPSAPETPAVSSVGSFDYTPYRSSAQNTFEAPSPAAAVPVSSPYASAYASSSSSSPWSSAPETPAVNPTETSGYTSYGSPAQNPAESPSSYSWGGGSGYGRAESAYTRADFTL